MPKKPSKQRAKIQKLCSDVSSVFDEIDFDKVAEDSPQEKARKMRGQMLTDLKKQIEGLS